MVINKFGVAGAVQQTVLLMNKQLNPAPLQTQGNTVVLN